MGKSNYERAAFILACMLYAETTEDKVAQGQYHRMAYYALRDMAIDLGYDH